MKSAIYIILLGLSLPLTAQQCATHDRHVNLMATDDTYRDGYLQSENIARHWRWNNNANDGQRALLLTIPVVVHVLYKDSLQNISDAQIQSQLDVLNTDYRALNSITLPSYFDTLQADVEIEFCLAQLDPLGNPTNGITRTSTPGGQLFGYFSPLDDAKTDASGGKDPWPTNEYLNIWVCELFPGLLGYAQFPGGAIATDGVVITTTAFGTVGNIDPLAPGGRTTVHEVGHWLGLRHIWGDDSDCTGSDSIPDTPNHATSSSQDCNTTLNSCSNEDTFWGVFDPTDMVQNYMDYSNDTCMGMFTKGQKQRMHSFLLTDPNRLALFSSPAGCSFLSVNDVTDIKFNIYPNPTHDLLNFQWSSEEFADVKIISSTGKLIKTFFHVNSGQLIDLNDLANGIYITEIKLMGGYTKTSRFIKN